MEKHKASKTADYVAAIRARHLHNDSHRIFEDKYAEQLTGKLLSYAVRQKLFNWLINSRFTPDIRGAEALVLYRAHYTEQKLEQAINNGCQQYVILAAGMDSFAYRHSYPQLSVFELDHPATQSVKLHRLKAAGISPTTRVEYIASDLSIHSPADALTNSSFNSDQITFFSCAGLTYYLPYNEVKKLLESIATISSSGSELVFDYSVDDVEIEDQSGNEQKNRAIIRRFLKKSGEEIKSAFKVTELIRIMGDLGFDMEENANPDFIHEAYFADRPVNDGLRASRHSYLGHFKKR